MTVSLGRIAREEWDVVVVGAGPAGSVTARQLAQNGHRVLLADRCEFPRGKVCGCCLNPRALAALERVNLLDALSGLGAVSVSSLSISVGGRTALIRRPLGVALSRERLDDALVRAACEAGATFLAHTRVSLGPPGDARPLAQLHQAGATCVISARSMVLATGLAEVEQVTPARSGRVRYSHVTRASYVGAGAIAARTTHDYTPGRIHMACGRHGYVGLVVLEDGRLDIAAALSPSRLRTLKLVSRVVHEVLEEAGLPAPAVDQLAWRGTPRLTRRPHRVAGGGVFRVGDAAGYVEPFTGEGMAWAIDGAVRLSAILTEHGLDQQARTVRLWRRAHRRAIRARQAACRAVATGLRHTWLVGSIVRLLRAAPELASPALRWIHES